MENNNFDGVFKFTNASKEDFTVMWNSKEYTFPAESTCPLIMPEFTLEEVQNIRKKFAYKYAQREFANSEKGIAIAREAAKHISPATYNEEILNDFVQQCLSPLPIAQAEVKVVAKKKTEFRDGGTAIVPDGASVETLSSAQGEFKNYVPPQLGRMEG